MTVMPAPEFGRMQAALLSKDDMNLGYDSAEFQTRSYVTNCVNIKVESIEEAIQNDSIVHHCIHT